MLMKTYEFILDVLKAVIIPRLSSSGDTAFEVSETDSEERKKYKIEYNERLERKKITGISNSWAQNEILKMCDENTDIPNHSYFSSFDGYLKKDRNTNKLTLDENKLKFNKSESMWAYGVFSIMFISCIALYLYQGFTMKSGVFIVILGTMSIIAFIGCLRLSPPSDKKVKDAKGYIDDYYYSVQKNDE
ncbi:hypothetical protein ABN242_05015 [Providencia alcalifaciens]|uniref:hypothetical protein n=1 Tax=Providencia alcalifaciens TaxID=126385 RepID=UPI0032DBEDCB